MMPFSKPGLPRRSNLGQCVSVPSGAPPVYRPQPCNVPVIRTTNVTSANQLRVSISGKQTVSSPLQQKSIHSGAPPVYRPQPLPRPSAPPVYRPQQPVQARGTFIPKLGRPVTLSPKLHPNQIAPQATAIRKAPQPSAFSAPARNVPLSSPRIRHTIAVQAKLLKNLPGKSVWRDDYLLKKRDVDSLLKFVNSKVAGFPNMTMKELFEELDFYASTFVNSEVQKARVQALNAKYQTFRSGVLGSTLTGGRSSLTWAQIKDEWGDLDDKLEKAYMEFMGNKWKYPQVTVPLSTGHAAAVDQADSGEAWRARGAHAGVRTQFPYGMDQHYAVDAATADRPGPARIYVATASLTEGEGVHVYYSAEHGERDTPVYRLIHRNKTIDGKRVVTPWDPYLNRTEGAQPDYLEARA